MGGVVRSRAKMIVAARAAGAATQTYLASILRAEQGGERTETHAYLSTSCRAPPKSRRCGGILPRRKRAPPS